MHQKQQDWQTALADAITDPKTLLRELELDGQLADDVIAASQSFSLRVPRGFVARMEKGNPHDPLLLQVLTSPKELNKYPGYSKDPVNEKQVNPIPGVLHKYHGRVLFTLTGGCAINCRYCFRRHFPYTENTPNLKKWQRGLDYIAADTSIEEVIFSGGDPLIVKDKWLANLVEKLAQIPHLKRLRIHTRLPVVLPERITDDCIVWVTSTRLKPVIVIHSNHPREIDYTVEHALQKLNNVNAILLNQSVLLKNINDNADTLIELSQTLFDAGVLPYYLHLLDPVQGAAHFDVDEKIGKELIQQMMYHLPGYLVPKLVREIPQTPAKTMI